MKSSMKAIRSAFTLEYSFAHLLHYNTQPFSSVLAMEGALQNFRRVLPGKARVGLWDIFCTK